MSTTVNMKEHRIKRRDYWLGRLKGYSLTKDAHFNQSFGGYSFRRGRWFVQVNPDFDTDRVCISYVPSWEN